MEILEFLKEWSPVIVPGLVIVLDLLIILIKKRPKTLDDFSEELESILNYLPYLINRYEEPGNGEKKKSRVLDRAVKIFKSKLGRELSVRENSVLEETISKQIELLLSTPQKKGD